LRCSRAKGNVQVSDSLLKVIKTTPVLGNILVKRLLLDCVDHKSEHCRPLPKLPISFINAVLRPNMSSKLSGFEPISYIFLILCFSVVTTAPMRGGGRGMRGVPRGRGNPRMNDMFRSRKQNTSRPPSMHVDDFMAMEHAKTQDSPPPMRRTGPKVHSTSFLLIIWCCFVLK